jgi:predicted tellurium resistance membrane protein TerC
MWQDINAHGKQAARGGDAAASAAEATTSAQLRSFWRALLTIIIADVSMSLDNVLAVAAVSRHNTAIMTFGLVLSVVMMGVAASLIARIIDTHRWIAVLGIIIILAAAARMMWEDLHIWFPSVFPAIPDLGGQFPPH